MSRAITVRTLTCHPDVDIAAEALTSLRRYSPSALRVVIHEDGSLTEKDKDELKSRVPDAELVEKAGADQCINAMLTKYPACREFRRKFPHALKLFDVMLLNSDDVVNFCDSDIVFLQPFAELFALPARAGCVFHPNGTQSYSVRSWQLLRHRKMKLVAGLNSGLFSFRKRDFDLDLLEWFFACDDFTLAPQWREQTAWALLAYAAGCWLWDETQVQIATPNQDLSHAVAVHYVRSRRSLFHEAPRPMVSPSAPRVRMRAQPARRCSVVDLVIAELGRQVARRLA